MSRKIDQLQRKINANNVKIAKLQNENNALLMQQHKLYGFVELDIVKDGCKKKTQLKGFTTFTEDFVDEDTGEVVGVERHTLVSINGELCDSDGNLIKDIVIEDMKEKYYNYYNQNFRYRY